MSSNSGFPGVYFQEDPEPRRIQGVATSVTAFVGKSDAGPVDTAVCVTGFREFQAQFGELQAESDMGYALWAFFLNGGREAWVVRLGDDSSAWTSALDQVDPLNLLCLPGATDASLLANAMSYCAGRRAFLLVDPPAHQTPEQISALVQGSEFPRSDCAALYYPWLLLSDPLQGNATRLCAPGGAVAGIFARLDDARGVWRAPSGREANVVGAIGVEHDLNDAEIQMLNPRGVNSIRVVPGSGTIVWGARTLADGASDWKYLSVRRFALYVEESIDRGTRWAVFEPNEEPLWAEIRRVVGAFLDDLFRQGTLQGQTPDEAYFCKCGRDTMTQDDIDQGNLVIMIGIAPLKPAEFVIIRIGHHFP